MKGEWNSMQIPECYKIHLKALEEYEDIIQNEQLSNLAHNFTPE